MEKTVGLAALLLLITSVVGVENVPLTISVNHSRPLGLYEGPSTYRRDARGRPLPSIIVTSKPFGFGHNIASNDIKQQITTTTTARPTPRFGSSKTTSSPSKSITIPFFNINCSVGQSCSQIISARKTPTPKPTFRPYNQQEIEKFKQVYGSRFPFDKIFNVTQTTSTTARPTTTKTPSASKSSTWNPWRWPVRSTEAPSINRNHQDTQESFNEVKLQTWIPNVTTPPTSTWKTTTPRPLSSSNGGWISLLSSSLSSSLTNWNKSMQKLTPKPTPKPWKSSSWSPAKPIEPSNHWSPQPKPKPQPNREITSTRGNKVSLITAVKTPVAPSYAVPVTLPPEVSVSSHVIALRVKPRQRGLSSRFENIQGVQVETDASDVNLSDLIMRNPLPSSRKRFRHIQNTPHWVPY